MLRRCDAVSIFCWCGQDYSRVVGVPWDVIMKSGVHPPPETRFQTASNTSCSHLSFILSFPKRNRPSTRARDAAKDQQRHPSFRTSHTPCSVHILYAFLCSVVICRERSQHRSLLRNIIHTVYLYYTRLILTYYLNNVSVTCI